MRPIGILALALVCLLASGCVYLRLLTLKDQFRDFDAQIEVVRQPPLGLRFSNPVLLAEDLDTLIGAGPTAEAAEGPVTVRIYAFQHIGLPPGNPVVESPNGVLSIDATIMEGKLAGIGFPPAVFNALDPRLAEAGLRSLARAQVDTTARTATSQVGTGNLPLPPDRQGLGRIFGQPSFCDQKDGEERWVYRYRLVPPAAGSAKPVIAAMAFGFKPRAAHPRRFSLNVNGLWLTIGLPEAP